VDFLFFLKEGWKQGLGNRVCSEKNFFESGRGSGPGFESSELGTSVYDTYDNTIKTCFIVLKQVELSAGLKWAVMTLICPC
jgi:hypothetical protein